MIRNVAISIAVTAIIVTSINLLARSTSQCRTTDYRFGDTELNIPVEWLSDGADAARDHASSRGSCGGLGFPSLALNYADWTPMPPGRRSICKARSSAICPDLIFVTLIGPEEPERVASFLRNFPTGDVRLNKYGLFVDPPPSDAIGNEIMMGFGDHATKVVYGCFWGGAGNPPGFCDGQRYLNGMVLIAYWFSPSLLPKWRQIDEHVARLISSFDVNN